jgi:hypothetical protein
MSKASLTHADLAAAVASLLTWPTVVLILGVLAILVFRRELKRLIERMEQIHAPGMDVKMTPPQPQLPAQAEARTSPPAPKEPDQLPPAPSDTCVAAEVEEESRFSRACGLLTSGEYAEGIKLMEEEARTETDASKQVALVAFGQHLAAAKGSKAALDDLRRTAREHEGIFDVNIWLAIALDGLGMNEEARAQILHAYDTATSDEDRATALIWLAQSRSRTERETSRVSRDLIDASRALKEHRALSRTYARAAELLLDSEPPDFDRSFALRELAV